MTVAGAGDGQALQLLGKLRGRRIPRFPCPGAAPRRLQRCGEHETGGSGSPKPDEGRGLYRELTSHERVGSTPPRWLWSVVVPRGLGFDR